MNAAVIAPRRLSVVIVTFNSAAQIGRCLEALYASDVDIELVVVDNCSEDDTVERINGFLRHRSYATVLALEINVGFARAVNLGLSRCSVDYAVILNPDCYVSMNTLSTMLSVMQSDASIGIGGCLLLNEDGTEQAGCRRYIPTPSRSLVHVLHLEKIPYLRSKRLFKTFVMRGTPMPEGPEDVEALSGALMMVRMEGVRAIGPLDERYFMHCEDLDWCVRFRRSGWRVVFVPTASAVHTKGCSSRSRPVRVEYYKHAGMVRFFQLHFRDRYSLPISALVVGAVWGRFFLKAVSLLPRSINAYLKKLLGTKNDEYRGGVGVK